MAINTSSLYQTTQDLASLTTNIQEEAGNNFYVTNDNFVVFEFFSMDMSQSFNVSTSFIPVIRQGQFTNVSAIATLTVPSINFSNLFHFKTDDNVSGDGNDWRINSSTNSIRFGCGNASTFTGISYSNASVTVGRINNATIYTNNTLIKQDYVRSLARDVTGGYAMSEIFTNEEQLFDGVTFLDLSFNTSMNQILEESISGNNGELYLDPADDDTKVALSCQNLVANLFALNSSVSPDGSDHFDNASTYSRGQLFLSDLALQTTDTNSSKEFRVFFRKNDVLAVKLTYAPYGSVNGVDSSPGNNAGNQIFSRSYKIYLVMDDSMDTYIDDWKINPSGETI